jgi:hypothetical protein
VLTVFSPSPKSAKIAALIARELTLIERLHKLGSTLALRKRAEIECELAVVHRVLKQLGYLGEAPRAARRRKRDDPRRRQANTVAPKSQNDRGDR